VSLSTNLLVTVELNEVATVNRDSTCDERAV